MKELLAICPTLGLRWKLLRISEFAQIGKLTGMLNNPPGADRAAFSWSNAAPAAASRAFLVHCLIEWQHWH